MKVLAIDTATEACSVALQDGDVVVSRFEEAGRAHTSMIMPMIESVLDERRIRTDQLNALAFGRGPGSFTGVRVAASIVQGLAFAAGVGVVGISTLATLAQRVHREHGADDVVACFDARMGEIYWGHFRIDQGGAMEAVCAEALSKAEATELPGAAFAAGRGFASYAALAMQYDRVDENVLPDAVDMITLAQRQLARSGSLSAAQAVPVYLRDEVAWKKPGTG